MNETNSQNTTPATEPTATPTRPKRRRWLSVLLSLVIFFSGLIVGTGGTLIVIRNVALQRIHHPETVPDRIARQLRRKLRLDDEQTDQVRQIVAERQLAFQKIRRDVQPQIEAELDIARQQIGEVLDDDQREKWEAHFDHLRKTWLPPPPE